MPQKGYANITVKASTYRMFIVEAEQARWSDRTIDNSRFLEMLLDGHGRPSFVSHDEKKILTRHGDKTEIERTATTLGVADRIPRVIEIYEQAASSSTNPKREYVAACALYIACKEAGAPKTIREIAEVTGLEQNELFSCATAIAMRLSLSISRTDPSSLVRKIAEAVNGRGFKYRISEKSIRDAVALLEQIKNNPVIEGRSPKTLAAWALYRSCKQNKDNISQKSIAHSANIMDSNLRTMTNALDSGNP